MGRDIVVRTDIREIIIVNIIVTYGPPNRLLPNIECNCDLCICGATYAGIQ